jgi:hypothetical protein
MKKRKRPASKKASKKRKPIMRHSREGVKSRKAKRATKAKRSAKGKRTAKAKRNPKARRTAKARPAAKKTAPKAKPAARKPPAKKVAPSRPARLRRGSTERGLEPPPYARGMGSDAAGQSGDIEDLSRVEDVDSESVEELLEEGQAFEAGVISGVEEADGEPGEVRTRQVPVDDVPEEYLDED